MPPQPQHFSPAAITYANLRVATLNVRSITNERNRQAFFQWLKAQPYDVIALQETGNFGTYNTTIANRWSKDWGERGKSHFTCFCGLLVNNNNFYFSEQPDVDETGRILSALLHSAGQDDDTLRITSVYLPADDSKQPAFLRTLRQHRDTFRHPNAVVMGDFNSIDNPRVDRNPPIHAADQETYHRISTWQNVVDEMLIPLDLVDTALPPKRGTAYFTHYHKKTIQRTDIPPARRVLIDYGVQEDAEEPGVEIVGEIDAPPLHPGVEEDSIILNMQSRIDYVLVSSRMLGSVSNQQVATCTCTWPDRLGGLDHRVVSATIFAADRPHIDRSLVLDERLLSDPDFVDKVDTIFADMEAERERFLTVAEYWDKCKEKILNMGLEYGKKKRKQNMKKKRNLTRDLERADATLDRDPRNRKSIAKQQRCLAELQELEKYELDRVALMAKVKFLEEGERATPWFTAKLHSRRKKAMISALKDKDHDDEVSADLPGISRIAEAFYKGLYSQEGTNGASQERLLSTITEKVSEESKRTLDADLTAAELSSAISEMAARSSPGSDGLTYSFYKTFQARIIPILMDMFNSIAPGSEAALPASHSESMTILLYKKGDNEKIENYRPISLTQCDYKIFTKALTNRINPVANTIINTHQTGFIPGRQGHDNVMVLDLLVHYFQGGDKGDASILSLDQQKAYDRVDWGYLSQCLERFGFGSRIRHWIDRCYSNLSAKIYFGNHISDSYEIKRGLRQGDPLAPILFNFVLEPFLLFYSRIADGPPIIGLPLKVAAFADDTHLLMGPDDGRRAELAIRLHQEASGALINKDKSQLIPLTRRAQGLIVIPDFQAEEFETPFVHLGIVLQAGGRQMATIEDEIIRKMEATIAGWRTRKMTFQGRITTLNTYFLSKLWYVAPFYTFSSSFYKQIDKLCKHVLWPTTHARIRLQWYQQSKESGGWGLLHPRHQVMALKAKWLARRKETGGGPRWAPLLDRILGETMSVNDVPVPTVVLDAPTSVLVKNLDTVAPPLPCNITASIKAYLELGLVQKWSPHEGFSASLFEAQVVIRGAPNRVVPGFAPTLASGYDVATARRYLDKKKHMIDSNKAIPQKISDRPALPRLMPLRAVEVDRTQNPIPRAESMDPIPDEQWKVAWARFWSHGRRPHERTFLYQLYHKAIWTNGYKSKFERGTVTAPECRWCITLDPPIAVFESRPHAFHECPRLSDEWVKLRARIERILGIEPLPTVMHQDLLCWPSVADLPQLAIHLHSTVAQQIWQTYCQLGDGEKQADVHLRGAIVSATKTRARVELARAIYRDQLVDAQRIRSRDRQAASEKHYGLFRKTWHHPPHINVDREGIEWGMIWEE